MKKSSLVNSLIASLLLYFALVYLVVSNNLPLYSFDKQVGDLISAVRPPYFVEFMKFVTTLGDGPIPAILSVVACIALGIRRKVKDSLFFAFTMLFGLALKSLDKFIINRPRPLDSLIQVTESSFPSGHAMLSLVFFSLCAFYLHSFAKERRHNHLISGAIALIVLAIGFSRIYLGVHWFSDVIGGYLLGLALLSAAFLVYKKI